MTNEMETRMKLKAFATLLLATATPLAAADAPLTPDEAALKAHVAFLASDALRGREAGTPDYQVAAEYVAAEMMKAGLEPAGPNGSWFQPVPLVTAKLLAPPTVDLTMDGRPAPLVFGEDFTATRSAPGQAEIDVDAPVVFAGYGVSDRAAGLDEYRGLDVRGKIVALLSTGPVGPPSEVAAHLGNAVERARTAAARGAVGVIFVRSARAPSPFASAHRNWDATSVTWVGPDGRPRDGGARALLTFSEAGSAKLFAGSALSYADVLAADKAGRPVRTGPLKARLRVRARFAVDRVASANVVGRLPGADPKLAGEHVVLSGHLDHIGVTSRPVNGDAINNGAMDNAIGIAAMLEVARAFQKSGERPKRSLLFAAVTAEEKGLIGSDYLAAHPLASAQTVVANVNLDMPLLTYRFTDLVAFGADRSTIGAATAAAAKAEGYTLSPDPAPEQAAFVRTDHYSFVKQGVPAVSLSPGEGGPGKAAWDVFRRDHYHLPSDEIDLPIDWTAARGFVRVNYGVARALANAADRPRWVAGDYFGTRYKGPMAK
jgi:Zn-dependent M28 family amino/carboxypeptidase